MQNTAPSELWLGYNGLVAPFVEIAALMVYQLAWDRRIAQAYGSVPSGIKAVVLLTDGRVLPSRRDLADLHARWSDWQAGAHEPRKLGPEGNDQA